MSATEQRSQVEKLYLNMDAMIRGPSPLPIKNTFIDFRNYDMPPGLPGRRIRSWDADHSYAGDGNAPSTSQYSTSNQTAPDGRLGAPPPNGQHCRVSVGAMPPATSHMVAAPNGDHMRPGGPIASMACCANHVVPASGCDPIAMCSNIRHMGCGPAQPPNGHDVQLSNVHVVHRSHGHDVQLSNVHTMQHSHGHDVQLSNVHMMHHSNDHDVHLHNGFVTMPPSDLTGMHPIGHPVMPSNPLAMVVPHAMMSSHMMPHHDVTSPHSMMSPHPVMLSHAQMPPRTAMPPNGLVHANPHMMNSHGTLPHAVEQRRDGPEMGLAPFSTSSLRTHWEDMVDDSDGGSIGMIAGDDRKLPYQRTESSYEALVEDKYDANFLRVSRSGRSYTSPKESSNGEVKGFTTLMLRNIPARYSQEQLLADLEKLGFKGNCFDFFYLPVDFGTRKNLGYAFVNCVNSKIALTFCNDIDGKTLPRYWSGKIIEVMPAAVQGFVLNVERFLNGPSKRIGNPYFRPIIFIDGVGCPLTHSSVHKKAKNSYNIKYR
eukprot:GEMP01011912.1.p1 GENE.GEMP01011912.1~~GEMP01011912.1.p1  ORF type:complete len:540 (+),score=104.60 GEMP01011912.1:75-1694(+)